MKEIFSSVTFEIQPRETVRMSVPRSAALSACGVRLWVTRRHDAEDYWLLPGEKLALAPRDVLWLSVEGDRAARVVLTTPARCDERFMRWLASSLGRLRAGGKAGRMAA